MYQSSDDQTEMLFEVAWKNPWVVFFSGRHFCQKMGEKTPQFFEFFWVNYNDLTTTSLEIMVSKGNHPRMALIQVSEIL